MLTLDPITFPIDAPISWVWALVTDPTQPLLEGLVSSVCLLDEAPLQRGSKFVVKASGKTAQAHVSRLEGSAKRGYTREDEVCHRLFHAGTTLHLTPRDDQTCDLEMQGWVSLSRIVPFHSAAHATIRARIPAKLEVIAQNLSRLTTLQAAVA